MSDCSYCENVHDPDNSARRVTDAEARANSHRDIADTMRRDRDSLRNELKITREILEGRKRRLKEVLDENADLKTSLSASREISEIRSQRIKNVTRENVDLESKLNSERERTRRLEGERDRVGDAFNTYKDVHASCRATDALRRELGELRTRLNNMNDLRESAHNLYNATVVQRDELRAELNQLRAELNEVCTERDDLRDILEHVNDGHADRIRARRALELEIQNLKGKLQVAHEQQRINGDLLLTTITEECPTTLTYDTACDLACRVVDKLARKKNVKVFRGPIHDQAEWRPWRRT